MQAFIQIGSQKDAGSNYRGKNVTGTVQGLLPHPVAGLLCSISGAHQCLEPMMSGSRAFLFPCSVVSQPCQQEEELRAQVCILASCKNM